MKNLNERIADVSGYLQSLTAPEFYSQVEEAVEKNDKKSVIGICRKAKIPSNYLSTVVSVLFSMSSPQQKWPEYI
jgi:hypothetical protein